VRLDEIVAFGGLLAIGLVGWFIWWRLGVAEERERREREAPPLDTSVRAGRSS
jgi:hypothetical protein